MNSPGYGAAPDESGLDPCVGGPSGGQQSSSPVHGAQLLSPDIDVRAGRGGKDLVFALRERDPSLRFAKHPFGTG